MYTWGGGKTHVPSKYNQHGSHRHFFDIPLVALLGFPRGVVKDVVADFQQMQPACDSGGDLLGPIGNRPPHLLGQLPGQDILLRSDQP